MAYKSAATLLSLCRSHKSVVHAVPQCARVTTYMGATRAGGGGAVAAFCRRRHILSGAPSVSACHRAAAIHLARFVGTAPQSSVSLCREQRAEGGGDGDAPPEDGSITDVLTRLYSIRRFHKSEAKEKSTVCGSLEQQAWKLMQGVSDEQISTLSANDLIDLLSSWIYFSQFWNRGLDGPSVLAGSGGESGWVSSSTASSSAGASGAEAKAELGEVSYPLLVRGGGRSQTQSRSRCLDAAAAPPPRASPLDEVIEF